MSKARKRALFSLARPLPAPEGECVFWQWRWAHEPDIRHKVSLPGRALARLDMASVTGDKSGLLLADFLYRYGRSRVADGRYEAIRTACQDSLLVADYDLLPPGFTNFESLREFLRFHYPSGLVLSTPSGKAKLLFWVMQDVAPDQSGRTRFEALRGILSDHPELWGFDQTPAAHHKVFFTLPMVTQWQEGSHRLRPMGAVSLLASWADGGVDGDLDRDMDSDVLTPSKASDTKSPQRVGWTYEDNAVTGREEAMGATTPDSKGQPRVAPADQEEGPGAPMGDVDGFPVIIQVGPTNTEAVTSPGWTAMGRLVVHGSGWLGRDPQGDNGPTWDHAVGPQIVAASFASFSFGGQVGHAGHVGSMGPNSLPAARMGMVAPRRYLGPLPASLLGVGGRSGAFEGLLRILLAAPRMDRGFDLSQPWLSAVLGLSQPMVSRLLGRLVGAHLLVPEANGSYVPSRKARTYRASGELLTLWREAACHATGGARVPPKTPETMLIKNRDWNDVLFWLTNHFETYDTYMAYVERLPGVKEKRTRIPQATAAWRSHEKRRGA